MTRHIICNVLLCAALIVPFPAMAQNSVKPEKLMLVWPDPTPEELAILPRDGCKELDEIKPVKEDLSNPDYIAWRQTPDGICYAWYKKRMDEAYVLGDVPPPTSQEKAYTARMTEDQRRNQARLLELKERIRRSNAERGIVPLSERMKPAGSNPAPSPDNPTPTVK